MANVSGKRTAVSHLIFKCGGVLLCLIFFPFLIDVLKGMSDSVAQQIVWAHFLVNLLIVIVFILFLKPFAALMKKVLPGADDVLPVWPEYINRRDLINPVRSLDHVRKELLREAKLVEIMLARTIVLMTRYEEGRSKDISYIEMVVNNLRAQIVRFLWKVSKRDLSADLSRRIFAYTAMAGDIKSIGNHIQSISALVTEQTARKIKFSDCGEKEFQEILSLVGRNLADASMLIETFNAQVVTDVISREEEIDVQVREALDHHLKRFHRRECSPEAGPFFVEILGQSGAHFRPLQQCG